MKFEEIWNSLMEKEGQSTNWKELIILQSNWINREGLEKRFNEMYEVKKK